MRLYRVSQRGIRPTAEQLGIAPGTLRAWVRQAEIDAKAGPHHGRARGTPPPAQEEPPSARGARHPQEGGGFLRSYVTIPSTLGELARFFAAQLLAVVSPPCAARQAHQGYSEWLDRSLVAILEKGRAPVRPWRLLMAERRRTARS